MNVGVMFVMDMIPAELTRVTYKPCLCVTMSFCETLKSCVQETIFQILFNSNCSRNYNWYDRINRFSDVTR